MLQANTSLAVTEVTGDDTSCSWSREEWQKAWSEAELFVMTPAVFVAALSHAFVPFSSILLMVFDEAHHCHGNSPYMQVMREHYFQVESPDRPSILGLSASPVDGKGSLVAAMRELEQYLDSAIVTVRDWRVPARPACDPPPCWTGRSLPQVPARAARLPSSQSTPPHALLPAQGGG